VFIRFQNEPERVALYKSVQGRSDRVSDERFCCNSQQTENCPQQRQLLQETLPLKFCAEFSGPADHSA